MIKIININGIVAVIEIDENAARKALCAKQTKPKVEKPVVKFYEIRNGYSNVRPDNGEQVLIRYCDEEDDSYDTVYFYEAGTKVMVNTIPFKTQVLDRTGFYKIYAGAKADGSDEFWYISPRSLSHWGRYPKLNK